MHVMIIMAVVEQSAAVRVLANANAKMPNSAISMHNAVAPSANRLTTLQPPKYAVQLIAETTAAMPERVSVIVSLVAMLIVDKDLSAMAAMNALRPKPGARTKLLPHPQPKRRFPLFFEHLQPFDTA
jgi:hypothetical protein